MVYWVGNHYTDGSLDYGVSCGHVHPTHSQATHKNFCTTACDSLVTGSHMHPLVSLTSQTLSVPQRWSLSVLAHGERVQRLRTTSREWVGHVWSTQIMYIHRLHLLDSCQCYLPSYLCFLSDDWAWFQATSQTSVGPRTYQNITSFPTTSGRWHEHRLQSSPSCCCTLAHISTYSLYESI